MMESGDLWFGLEVAAATLSVVNLLLATAYLIIVCSGLCGPEDDDGGVSTSHRQVFSHSLVLLLSSSYV